jgi:hypothetical protein
VTAAAALREATLTGVTLRLGADGKAKVGGDVAPELLAWLREHRSEIVEILSADRCRWCGEPLAWPGPAGIMLADGTAECMPCADGEVWRLMAATERAVASPDALADPAEVMLRGELHP